MTERRVYLYGYQGRRPAELLDAAQRLDLTVLDTRYSPRSRRPEWSGVNLARLLGDRYVHASGFGNLLYKSTANVCQLADAERGLREFDATTGAVVLLCVCPQSRNCHRSVVADLLVDQRGVRVAELDDALEELSGRQLSIFSEGEQG